MVQVVLFLVRHSLHTRRLYRNNSKTLVCCYHVACTQNEHIISILRLSLFFTRSFMSIKVLLLIAKCQAI